MFLWSDSVLLSASWCFVLPGGCVLSEQMADSDEFLYFEVKNKNMTENTSIAMGKAALK